MTDLRTASGFEVVRTAPLRHIDGELHELVHVPTGARHVHVSCDDDSNAFAITVRTIPDASDGVAHILEHCVLAGSRRFPVRTFFGMQSGSLSPDMNASTGYDRTIFAFTTRNPKDFRNLADVYLDAVFHPLLQEEMFRQEGWRLEFEHPDDPGSPLRFKGVVLNEMKAGAGSAFNAIVRGMGEAIFPGTTYAVVTGGDPERILDLTYERLRDFHATYYHPSNTCFYSYGNLPLEPTLELIASALEGFGPHDVDGVPPLVRRFTEPREHTVRFAIGAGEDASKRAQAVVTWATADTTDLDEILALQVLGSYLLDNDGAPLREALLSSGLGTALADLTGFHAVPRESAFLAGLKDVRPSDAPEVERIVLDTLRAIAERGVDAAALDATIHQLELRDRTRSNEPFAYGLQVLYKLLGPFTRGGDVAAALDVDGAWARLRARRAQPGSFEALDRRWFLDNPHRALVTAIADPDLEPQRDALESARLAEIAAGLDDAGRGAIVADAARLKAIQDGEPDHSCLPSLDLADLDTPISDAVADVRGRAELYAQPTGGISYVDVLADYASLPDELRDDVSLYAAVLPRIGAAGLSPAQMAARTARWTGGLTSGAGESSRGEGPGPLRLVTLGGRALGRDQGELVAILRDLLLEPSFEEARIAELIAERAAQLQTDIAGYAILYALHAAASMLSADWAMADRIAGVAHVRRIRRLDAGRAAASLEAIREHLAGTVTFVATASATDVEPLAEAISEVAGALPAGPAGPRVAERAADGRSRAYTIPVGVAANVKAFDAVRFDHPDAPALAALSHYLFGFILYPEIREKGGAYGSMARSDPAAGLFVLGSGSDPHIVRTHEVWRSIVPRLHDGPVEPRALKNAIVSAARDLDPLGSPDTRGRTTTINRLAGRTAAVRETFRRRLLDVTADDLRRVAATYLVEERSTWATVASEDAVARAGDLFDLVEPLL